MMIWFVGSVEVMEKVWKKKKKTKTYYDKRNAIARGGKARIYIDDEWMLEHEIITIAHLRSRNESKPSHDLTHLLQNLNYPIISNLFVEKLGLVGDSPSFRGELACSIRLLYFCNFWYHFNFTSYRRILLWSADKLEKS